MADATLNAQTGTVTGQTADTLRITNSPDIIVTANTISKLELVNCPRAVVHTETIATPVSGEPAIEVTGSDDVVIHSCDLASGISIATSDKPTIHSNTLDMSAVGDVYGIVVTDCDNPLIYDNVITGDETASLTQIYIEGTYDLSSDVLPRESGDATNLVVDPKTTVNLLPFKLSTLVEFGPFAGKGLVFQTDKSANYVQGVQILNNTLSNGLEKGIEITNAARVRVVGNVVSHMIDYGIKLTNCHDVEVVGNYCTISDAIFDAGEISNGIGLFGILTNAVIKSNVCEQCGIEFSSSAYPMYDVKVLNNHVSKAGKIVVLSANMNWIENFVIQGNTVLNGTIDVLTGVSDNSRKFARVDVLDNFVKVSTAVANDIPIHLEVTYGKVDGNYIITPYPTYGIRDMNNSLPTSKVVFGDNNWLNGSRTTIQRHTDSRTFYNPLNRDDHD